MREVDLPHRPSLVARDGAQECAIGDVVDVYAVAGGEGRGEPLAVGTETDGGDGEAVAAQSVDKRPVACAPELDRRVAARGDEQLAVGREGDLMDVAAVRV